MTGRPGALSYVLVTLILLGTAMGATCSGSGPTRHYYVLAYPLPEAESLPPSGFKYPFTIRVKKFEVSMAYNRPQIVYRFSPYEFKYYNYKHWTAKPQHMLRDLVMRHIKAVGLFQGVSLGFSSALPDYELVAEIEGIEEYDSGDTWYAHLAMRFKLIEFDSKKTVWMYAFDEKKKVFNKQPVYVVKALSEIVQKEMDVIVGELDAHFAKVTGAEPGLPWIKAATPVEAVPPVKGSGGSPDDLVAPEENPWSDPWESAE